MPIEELYVHTSYLASDQDEERFRSLAAAYEDFEAARTHIILPTEQQIESETDAESQDARPASNSTGGNRSLQAAANGDPIGRATDAEESQHFQSQSQVESDKESIITTFIDDTQLAWACIESNPLSPKARRSQKRSKADSSAGDQVVESYDEPSQKRKRSQSIPSEEDPSDGQGSLRVELACSYRDTDTQPASQDLRLFSEIRSEILPDPAEVGMETAPVYSITPALKDLFSESPSEDRINLDLAARKLHNHERGYWRIETHKWSSEEQLSFWKYLEVFLQEGKAKWHITVFRDGGFQSLGLVKIVCWAEIVQHTWLLACKASDGKVLQARADWIDCEGKVVLTSAPV